ncbi:SRPBCC domain-containing protein [Kineosporia sp. J2-2]|uniref:SRPBCC domain-containing protein n=1 Tax=Kineosporia corallincola TaxID=2835133 RepID=A0ABS5TB75_9ACTN|nr:SRPBCC domain-containing protein [Kineosporia corallincola]MBT0768327.1 SRPBCC domain-containing protein [Kineosporia corallincola]
MTSTDAPSPAAQHTLSTTHDAPASPAALWDAWARVHEWWGPSGFRSTVREFDFTEGGRFEVVMHGPDGTDYPNLYVFDELTRPTRVIWTSTGSQEFGLAPFRSVLHCEPRGPHTRITLTAYFPSAEEKRRHVEDFGAEQGSRDLLRRLGEEAARS